MLRVSLALLPLLSLIEGQWDLAARARCWTSGNGRAAQWWNDGERIDRGKYWYTCRRGDLSPMGCFTNDNRRISLYENYVDGGYEITCTLDARGYLVFQTTACVSAHDKVHHRLGEQWVDPSNTYYFECKQDGPYLKETIVGCLSHDKTRRLVLGESYDYGDYRYECQRKFNGSVSMCSIGCVEKGRYFKVGEQFDNGEYVYYCKSNKGRCQKVCVGCLWRQKRLYDGDRFRDQGTVYQCEIREDSFGRRAVGCHVENDDGTTMDRVIGCRWFLNKPDSKIQQTCERDGENSARIVTEACIYVYKGYDTLQLEPNTYTIWNPPLHGKPVALTCRTTPTGGAELKKFDVDQIYNNIAGLKYDTPRG